MGTCSRPARVVDRALTEQALKPLEAYWTGYLGIWRFSPSQPCSGFTRTQGRAAIGRDGMIDGRLSPLGPAGFAECNEYARSADKGSLGHGHARYILH